MKIEGDKELGAAEAASGVAAVDGMDHAHNVTSDLRAEFRKGRMGHALVEWHKSTCSLAPPGWCV